MSSIGTGGRRVLVVGWSSVENGECTAGDQKAMWAVADAVAAAGHRVDIAWSTVMSRAPLGSRAGRDVPLADVDPSEYTHLLWVCGPVSGSEIEALHRRFAHCRRYAVGVSVVDVAGAAYTGFDEVFPRDIDVPAGESGGARCHAPPVPDLAAAAAPGAVPVVGVFTTSGQREYGTRRRHGAVAAVLDDWLASRHDLAVLDLDTRLDPRSWRSPSTSAAVESVVRRLDVVVTMRLHGLVLALSDGIPALAIDPVAGGAKVTAQATAWGWPAVLAADDVDAASLSRWTAWCLSDSGRTEAAQAAARVRPVVADLLVDVVRALA
ncbi:MULTISPECIES: polysaccharide pyruvyl transferase family protein [unclassified Rhodococcus (in: high G+C Gram-positive bacteria)]|uniref:polysaccharide pyruvyl transferase family protein n=1 Tax=unclassified Rhodococcus (in: high G+C Gram-positive bacteria) TaxID=192944 RepID=UPI002E2D2D92|nr:MULTISPECIES: polysaccharide pyruvyl transferase family protein [unclassified Rhodococcus (in: high G+C Gram-positive bacteria)]